MFIASTRAVVASVEYVSIDATLKRKAKFIVTSGASKVKHNAFYLKDLNIPKHIPINVEDNSIDAIFTRRIDQICGAVVSIITPIKVINELTYETLFKFNGSNKAIFLAIHRESIQVKMTELNSASTMMIYERHKTI